MKLSHLKQLVQEYDKQKGLGRELFGDALQIRVLKELINDIEANSNVVNDPEITLQDYQSFAIKNSYDIDLSDNYLASNSASSHIFTQWKLTELANEFSFNSIDLSSVIPSTVNLIPQTVEIPAITQILFENQIINMPLVRELCKNHKENYPIQIQELFFKNNLNINLENIIINNNEAETLNLILEQRRQFKDTARIRMAARVLAQLHRNHSIFSQLHKDTCVKIAVYCSDNSLDEKQAIKIAEESFDKPKLMPK